MSECQRFLTIANLYSMKGIPVTNIPLHDELNDVKLNDAGYQCLSPSRYADTGHADLTIQQFINPTQLLNCLPSRHLATNLFIEPSGAGSDQPCTDFVDAGISKQESDGIGTDRNL